jgi:hypothetical protein
MRIVAASSLVAATAYFTWAGLDDRLGSSLAGQLISVGTALTASTAVYLLACWALRVRELGALLALRDRLKGA